MFHKASKTQSKLRLALFAPSGGGKTFTALRIAKGLGGSVAVIDSEKGSASKYADRFSFDVAELTDPKIENYIQFIREAKNYDVLIIDSLTHGWQELLEEVERIAKGKYHGNTWSAWSEGTPKQKALVNAILAFPGHIISTMRVKTEWTTEKGSNGKTRPVRVGLSPEQGKGIEYEFDLLMQISEDHIAHIIKDRTGKFQDKLIDKPGEEFGKELNEWLGTGTIIENVEPFEQAKISEPVVLGEKTPKKRGRKASVKKTEPLFPLVSDCHVELDKILKDKKDVFTNTHYQWIIDQIKNDASEEKTLMMLDHVNKVCSSQTS